MTDSHPMWRRLGSWLAIAFVILSVTWSKRVSAFGDQVGVFDPRLLFTGVQSTGPKATGISQWSAELVQRTSAPARFRPTVVRADDPTLTDAPFLYWSGDTAVAPLSAQEVAGLKRFFSLGGIMLVDDAAPSSDGSPGAFGRSARRELALVLTDGVPIDLPLDHVIYRTFYLLHRAEGRILGRKTLEGIVRGGVVRVIFSNHDIGGALSRGPTGVWANTVTPGGDAQRERAIRLAVNIAMYVLCSNYKDDQVHAPFLMRRRAMASDSEP